MSGVRPFLFGKLPAVGDFLARGLGAEDRARWDERCSAAIAQARARHGAAFDRQFEATPPRCFLQPAAGVAGGWEAGVVAASRDRVGRPYPFLLGAVGAGPVPRPRRDVFDRLESCLYAAFEQPPGALDALLDGVTAVFREEPGSDAAAPADWMPWDRDWIGSPDMPLSRLAHRA